MNDHNKVTNILHIISKTHNKSTSDCLESASDLSILLPSTSKGIPLKEGFVKSSWSSLFDMGTLSLSAESTTYLTLHPQYIQGQRVNK